MPLLLTATPASRAAWWGRLLRIGFTSAGLAYVLIAPTPAAATQSANDADSAIDKHLSLDELMNLDVTSVSKEAEPYEDAPAAIDVITNEQIRRSAATDLPEALRLADNLEVAQDASDGWAISARGFDANLGDKLLVLIDGRAVYSPLYGGVIWAVQDTPLPDVDRIEVISGPGGTLWGANAVNGVINITTQSAQATQGLYLEQAVGDQLEDQTTVRYGGVLGSDVYFRVYAEYSRRAGEALSDGSSAQDSSDMNRAGFRADTTSGPNQLTLQGDFYSGTEYEGATGDTGMEGGNLLGRWSRTLAPGSVLSVEAYYDRTHLSIPSAASPPKPPYSLGFPASALVDDLDTYNLDVQHQLQLGSRNAVVWGMGYRYTHEADTGQSFLQFYPPVLEQRLYNVFAQDEIKLWPTGRLTVGSKLEHNDYTGFEAEPSVRLQWSLPGKQSLWSAVSRAVRTPSRYDRDLLIPSGLVNAPPPFQFPTSLVRGSPEFVSETELAYELGYRAELSQRASVALSLFYNDYDHLRSTSETAVSTFYPYPLPIYFGNNLEGYTYGAELSADYQVADWWRLHAAYDPLKEHLYPRPGTTDFTDGHYETADPDQRWSLRSSWNLPHRIELDATLRWVGSLTVDNGPTGGTVVATVPSYYESDARIGWRPVERLELSIAGQNLLHAYHQEYGFPTPTTEYIQRSVYGKAVWRY